MKKMLILGVLALALALSGCGEKEAAATNGEAASAQLQQTAASAPKTEQTADAKLSLQLADRKVTVTIADNAATQRLLGMLPTELSLTDFNSTEKIAYPPSKLSVSGAPKGHAPKAGDMCIYVPWGNICIFYHDYKFSSDLVYLGHVDEGLDILSSQKTDFKVQATVAK